MHAGPRAPRPYALAIWFAALALLAGLRYAMKLARAGVDAAFAPAAWPWLAGAVLLAAVAVAVALRERAR